MGNNGGAVRAHKRLYPAVVTLRFTPPPLALLHPTDRLTKHLENSIYLLSLDDERR